MAIYVENTRCIATGLVRETLGKRRCDNKRSCNVDIISSDSGTARGDLIVANCWWRRDVQLGVSRDADGTCRLMNGELQGRLIGRLNKKRDFVVWFSQLTYSA